MSEIKKEKGHFRRNWLFYSLLVTALGVSSFLWLSKSMAIKKQAKEFQAEKTMLLEQAQEKFRINSEQHLELMMKTFSWAVRSELTRGNQEQVDQYFKQLVKSEKVEEITLVDKKGNILLSTNKKNEGSKIATDYAKAALEIEEMTILDKVDKQIVAAPVMSLDSRLGTLLVIHKKDVFQLEDKIDLTKNK